MNLQRPQTHIIEDESKDAFKAIIGNEWITSNLSPDYAIDQELTIVEKNIVTHKKIWIQLKSTHSAKGSQPKLQMDVKHLLYYEDCQLPVVLALWVKDNNRWYHIFVQQYIGEQLDLNSPNWRSQKSVVITFQLENILYHRRQLSTIAADGFQWIIEKRLKSISDPRSALYWFKGHLKSDDHTIHERNLKVIDFLTREDYLSAIDELEDILRTCTIGPGIKVQILNNLALSYYSSGQLKKALSIYDNLISINNGIEGPDSLQSLAIALANIGHIHFDIGNMSQAEDCFMQSLELNTGLSNLLGIAAVHGSLGNLRATQGNYQSAFEHHSTAFEIDKTLTNLKGMAEDAGNMALAVHKMKNSGHALTLLDVSQSLYESTHNHSGVARQCTNKGLVLRELGRVEESLEQLEKAKKIHEDHSITDGIDITLCNLGATYLALGRLNEAKLHLARAHLLSHKKITLSARNITTESLKLLDMIRNENNAT